MGYSPAMDETTSMHHLLRFRDHGASKWGLLREDTVYTVDGSPLAGEWQVGPPAGALAEIELLVAWAPASPLARRSPPRPPDAT